MKESALLAAVVLVMVGCSGSSTVSTGGGIAAGATSSNGAGGSTNDTGNPGTTTGNPGTTTGNPGTTTGSACKANGVYVGAGNAGNCCSDAADSNGICYDPNANTAGSTTGTGAAATGTTTGGTCPANMPDINSGVANVLDGGTCSGELSSCPNGFTCTNGQCILHGANGGVQVTLSFDDTEDLDLHVIEPGGCEVYYGHTQCPNGGSLDRDSNAGCEGATYDGVNIENVIYPATGYPHGTYKVRMDYWKDCNNKASSNYGVQVRANGAVYKYCGTVTKSQADHGGQGAGLDVTTFTIP